MNEFLKIIYRQLRIPLKRTTHTIVNIDSSSSNNSSDNEVLAFTPERNNSSRRLRRTKGFVNPTTNSTNRIRRTDVPTTISYTSYVYTPSTKYKFLLFIVFFFFCFV